MLISLPEMFGAFDCLYVSVWLISAQTCLEQMFLYMQEKNYLGRELVSQSQRVDDHRTNQAVVTELDFQLRT